MICIETVKKYCNGDVFKIENYKEAMADNSQTWDLHHRLETHTSEGLRRKVPITQIELEALEMYYQRPAEELIFMKQADHKYLHQKGGHLSEAHRRSISVKNRLNAVTRCSAEMRRKLSEIAKARKEKYFLGHHHTEETKRILSENHKGICKNKHWFNNGKIEVMDYTMPEGFSKGRLYHARTGVEK